MSEGREHSMLQKLQEFVLSESDVDVQSQWMMYSWILKSRLGMKKSFLELVPVVPEDEVLYLVPETPDGPQ